MMMRLAPFVCWAAIALFAASLSGCGGGSEASTTTATTTTATTTTSTSTAPPTPPPPPTPASMIAHKMNAAFYSFDSSAHGVYIRQSEKSPVTGLPTDPDFDTKVGIFCAPKLPCFQGQSDCRVTGSLYNSKQMLQGNNVAWSFGKGVGWFVNSSASIKCSYAWDGATPNKYNHGCGCSAKTTNCSDPNNAWNNTDPTTGKQYTDKNMEQVGNCVCEKNPTKRPTVATQPDCFWTGPAFVNGSNSSDDTLKMLQWRVDHQDNAPSTGLPSNVHSAKAYWNEVILDAHVLLGELKKDAAATIPAIVYTKGNAPQRTLAQKIVANMQAEYHAWVPIIAIDPSVDVTTKKDVFLVERDEDYQAPTYVI